MASQASVRARIVAAMAEVVAAQVPVTGAFAAVFTKLPTVYSTNDALNTEAADATWTNIAHDPVDDQFWTMGWQARPENFNPAVDQWQHSPRIGNGVHNRTYVVDPFNHRLIIGVGSGGWWVPGTTTPMSPQPGMVYMDLAVTPRVVTPFTIPSPWGWECAAHVDVPRRRLVIFGGWQNLSVRTMALDAVYGPTVVAPNAGGPQWSVPLPGSQPGFRDVQRMTMWASGVDNRGRSIYVEPIGRVWVLPHDTLKFALMPTSGDLPPQQTHYTVDPRLDCIVAWSSGDGAPGAGPGAAVNELRVCPLDTLVWQKIAYTGPTPVIASYVSLQLVDDPVRARQILHVTKSNWSDLHTYALKVTRS